MKKNWTILCAVAALFAVSAQAQLPDAVRLGVAASSTEVSYAAPTTTVRVTLTIQKKVVRTGPYARFAQKYLGVMVPLSDKNIYVIQEARIETVGGKETVGKVGPEAELPPMPTVPGPAALGEDDFMKVTPDRMSIGNKSQEELAREAATTLFSLRKHRFDLITGEAGENVFGAGLEAALREIDRMEGELLALFLGKQYEETLVKEFTVVPEAGKTNYIVCRFSADQGTMSGSDLSGTPLILSVESEKTFSPLPEKREKTPKTYYAVPDYARCRLLDGTTELATVRIPIYQFGGIVGISEPALKR